MFDETLSEAQQIVLVQVRVARTDPQDATRALCEVRVKSLKQSSSFDTDYIVQRVAGLQRESAVVWTRHQQRLATPGHELRAVLNNVQNLAFEFRLQPKAQPSPAPFDLLRALRDEVYALQPALSELQLRVKFQHSPSAKTCPVTSDAALLSNLFCNALRAALLNVREATQIEIKLQETEHIVSILLLSEQNPRSRLKDAERSLVTSYELYLNEVLRLLGTCSQQSLFVGDRYLLQSLSLMKDLNLLRTGLKQELSSIKSEQSTIETDLQGLVQQLTMRQTRTRFSSNILSDITENADNDAPSLNNLDQYNEYDASLSGQQPQAVYDSPVFSINCLL